MQADVQYPYSAPPCVELQVVDDMEGFLLCPSCGYIADELNLKGGEGQTGTVVLEGDDGSGAAGECITAAEHPADLFTGWPCLCAAEQQSLGAPSQSWSLICLGRDHVIRISSPN